MFFQSLWTIPTNKGRCCRRVNRRLRRWKGRSFWAYSWGRWRHAAAPQHLHRIASATVVSSFFENRRGLRSIPGPPCRHICGVALGSGRLLEGGGWGTGLGALDFVMGKSGYAISARIRWKKYYYQNGKVKWTHRRIDGLTDKMGLINNIF